MRNLWFSNKSVPLAIGENIRYFREQKPLKYRCENTGFITGKYLLSSSVKTLLEKYDSVFHPGAEATPFIEHRINIENRSSVSVSLYIECPRLERNYLERNRQPSEGKNN